MCMWTGARVTIENSKEETVLDKAVKWSDPRVTAKVQYKYEQVVPPMTEAELAKKKKEKQRKKSKGNSPQKREHLCLFQCLDMIKTSYINISMKKYSPLIVI